MKYVEKGDEEGFEEDSDKSIPRQFRCERFLKKSFLEKFFTIETIAIIQIIAKCRTSNIDFNTLDDLIISAMRRVTSIDDLTSLFDVDNAAVINQIKFKRKKLLKQICAQLAVSDKNREYLTLLHIIYFDWYRMKVAPANIQDLMAAIMTCLDQFIYTSLNCIQLKIDEQGERL